MALPQDKRNSRPGADNTKTAKAKTSSKQQDTTSTSDPQGKAGGTAKRTERQKQAGALRAALEHEGHTFKLSTGEPWITLDQADGTLLTARVSSKDTEYWLDYKYGQLFHALPDFNLLPQVAHQHSARARQEAPTEKVFLRLAHISPEELWVDLGRDGLAVKVTPGQWDVEQQPRAIAFTRPPGYLPMPIPVRGGSIHDIRPFLNCPEGDPASEFNYRRMLMWLIGSYHLDADQVILALNGEQGSGKTTTNWCLRQLVDPNEVDASIEPKCPDDVMFQGKQSWVIAFDNLRRIPADMSDAFCRVSTGAAYTKRKLYTDDDPVLWSFRRPVIINGIERLVFRSDMMHRTLVVELPSLEGRPTRAKERYKREFAEAQPRILGGLLDVIADVLVHFPTMEQQIPHLHRMGDFHTWTRAAERALGWEVGSVDAIMRMQQRAVDLTKPGEHPVLETLASYMAYGAAGGNSKRLLYTMNVERRDGGVGVLTMGVGDLLKRLRDFAHELECQRNLIGWPESAEQFGRLMKRAESTLRILGLTITDGERTTTRRTLVITYDPALALTE